MLEADEKAGHAALTMEYEHSLMSLCYGFEFLAHFRSTTDSLPAARDTTPSPAVCSVNRANLPFRGYPQSDESGDGAEDEPAAGKQAEHAEGGSADEQAQPSEYTQRGSEFRTIIEKSLYMKQLVSESMIGSQAALEQGHAQERNSVRRGGSLDN
ncbi:hypothetical protein WN55_10791 [Dufourea novaeangliae]|uniref:Uncharacterized protein n=1 Tax=Dufourea novaeangliae TaxID=178035 RepID=A0A154PBX0_DUFNO|nr:hypothetical protein WN55_10791 [Dufourea novaeangliae]